MWHCHRPAGAPSGRGQSETSSPERARLVRLTVAWRSPPVHPWLDLHIRRTDGVHRRGVGGPKSASVGGVPEPECGCSGRCRAGAGVRGVTSYLGRKRSYCWPCLVHDGARRMMLLISHSATLCSCLLLPAAAAPTLLTGSARHRPEVRYSAFKIKPLLFREISKSSITVFDLTRFQPLEGSLLAGSDADIVRYKIYLGINFIINVTLEHVDET